MVEFERWIVLRSPVALDGDDVMRMTGEVAAETKVEIESIPTSAIADLENDPNIIAAAPEMPTTLIEPYSDTGGTINDAWGVDAVGAVASAYDGTGVRVAVLDTGIDVYHPAFSGISINQHDFSGDGDGDQHGHGTHCAGTIFGRDVGQRIGVARGIENVLIGKVLNDKGRGTTTMLLDAINWASRMRTNVVSMSVGFDTPGLVEKRIEDGWPAAIAASIGLEAYRKNLRLFDRQMSVLRAQREDGREPLLVAASGNESLRNQDPKFRVAASLPAAADGVFSVGALSRSPEGFHIADFSNTLPKVSGPGVDVVSAWPGGGLKSLSGTSMACPHVAGIAAMFWQKLDAAANAETVSAQLIGNAVYDGFAPGYQHTDVGMGLVKAP